MFSACFSKSGLHLMRNFQLIECENTDIVLVRKFNLLLFLIRWSSFSDAKKLANLILFPAVYLLFSCLIRMRKITALLISWKFLLKSTFHDGNIPFKTSLFSKYWEKEVLER